jgi:hypothetical protein
VDAAAGAAAAAAAGAAADAAARPAAAAARAMEAAEGRGDAPQATFVVLQYVATKVSGAVGKMTALLGPGPVVLGSTTLAAATPIMRAVGAMGLQRIERLLVATEAVVARTKETAAAAGEPLSEGALEVEAKLWDSLAMIRAGLPCSNHEDVGSKEKGAAGGVMAGAVVVAGDEEKEMDIVAVHPIVAASPASPAVRQAVDASLRKQFEHALYAELPEVAKKVFGAAKAPNGPRPDKSKIAMDAANKVLDATSARLRKNANARAAAETVPVPVPMPVGDIIVAGEMKEEEQEGKRERAGEGEREAVRVAVERGDGAGMGKEVVPLAVEVMVIPVPVAAVPVAAVPVAVAPASGAAVAADEKEGEGEEEREGKEERDGEEEREGKEAICNVEAWPVAPSGDVTVDANATLTVTAALPIGI